MFTRTGDAKYPSTLRKHGKEQSFQTVRDEAIKLIESLGPNVNFGIVRWSGGAYSWKPELVSATDENKKGAIEHIQNEVDCKKARANKGRPGGTRHDYALEEAFSLKPEVIYMLTDGNATASNPGGGGLQPIPPEQIFKVIEDSQKTLPKSARIHVIYYVTGKEKADERQMLMNLAGRTSGKFTRVEARGGASNWRNGARPWQVRHGLPLTSRSRELQCFKERRSPERRFISGRRLKTAAPWRFAS